MRQSLKETERLAAERRGQTALRYQHWEDGKGGEQVSTGSRSRFQIIMTMDVRSLAGCSRPTCREIVGVC